MPDTDTVVLIHGLWMTPRSWEPWKARFEGRGLRVLTPAYPGFEVEVEALRADPTPIRRVTVPQTVDFLAELVRALPRPPILIGHSMGGGLVQLLLARGLGAAGVAIHSVPTEGVWAVAPSELRVLGRFLLNPVNRGRAVGFTQAQFHDAFCNTLSREASDEVYERYHIPAPGRWVFDGALANVMPGRQPTWVDYTRDDRAPLLFVTGTEDHLFPPSIARANARRYGRSAAVTELRVYPGRSHWTCGEPGWEKVADESLAWALEHAGQRPVAG